MLTMHPDHVYLDLVSKIRGLGEFREDRTGTGTVSLFGPQMEFDLIQGFPLLTTKKINFKSIWTELLWFLKGDTNVAFLQEHGCNIWNEWANKEGDLGPVYGEMWRSWPAYNIELGKSQSGEVKYHVESQPIDQIQELIKNLREKPFSRRHIVSGWNPALLPDESLDHSENIANGKQVLPPCHTIFQFYVHEMSTLQRLNYAEHQLGFEDAHQLMSASREEIAEVVDALGTPERGLQCKLYQRSADMFLGVPYNIASYSLLTHIIAEMLDMAATRFIHSFGDAHIYSNHFKQFDEQFARATYDSPKLWVNPDVRTYLSVDELKMSDVELIGYKSHDFIKAPVAV